MRQSVLVPLVSALIVRAFDPSIPCTSGTCSYEAGDGSTTAFSLLTINTDTPTSLSDITSAAGWDIIECDPYSVGPQDIRLLCTDPSKGCDHLFQGGEENTIVRLPDTCAGGPFARVVKSWIPDDQTVPARLAKRQNDRPVRALTLDFDFAQIPESNGKVYITASATNSQVQRDAITQSAAKRSLEPLRHATRKSRARAGVRAFVQAGKKRHASRGFFDVISDAAHSVGDAITGAAQDVSNFLGDATTTVEDGLEQAENFIEDKVDDVKNFVNSLTNSTHFDGSVATDVHALDINESFPVFSYTLSCASNGSTPDFDASLTITAAVNAQVNADVGFIVTGSIVPPKIDDLAFTTSLDGSVAAAFDLQATVKGTFSTGLVPLFKTGLPGLTFPGILTVGPIISLNALAKATLGITADLNMTATFDIPQVDLVFPPSQGQSVAQVTPKDTPVNVNVGLSETLSGRAEVHLVPRLEIGVEILGGADKTVVFLNLDGSSGVDFTLSATETGTIVNGTGSDPVFSLDDLHTAFGGTVGADVGFSITAGATADLSPFFDHTVSLNLFSKTFPLFKDTFGTPPASKRSTLVERADTSASISGLACPLQGDINMKQPILAVPPLLPQQQ